MTKKKHPKKRHKKTDTYREEITREDMAFTEPLDDEVEEKEEEIQKEIEEEELGKEEVILMNPPREMKKIVGNVEEIRKQLEIPDTQSTSKKKESATPLRSEVPKDGSLSLGSVFSVLFGGTFTLFLLGKIVGVFGPLNFAVFALWPLILIFFGLSLFKVSSRAGKIFGSIVVLILFVSSLGILFRGGTATEVILSGDVKNEGRSVELFDEVIFEGVGDVTIAIGEEPALFVEGDTNILEELETTVSDGVLTITYESPLFKAFLFESSYVDVTIVVPEITAVHLVGAGTIEGSGIVTETLTTTIEGSGEINLSNIAVDTLVSKVRGAGTLSYEGTARRQIVDIIGSVNYNADTLKSDEAGIRLKGEGSMYVYVTDLLDVQIRNAGAVYYKGDPVLSNKSVGSLGVLEKKGEEFFDAR